MPLPQLKPEILLVIFNCLLRPLPPVQASFDDRSAIGQPDLVNCLKVNKAWYNLAGVLLYRTIVTDDLPRLLYPYLEVSFSDSLKIPGVFCKADLLGMTRRLCLEYCHKEVDREGVFGWAHGSADDYDLYPAHEHAQRWDAEVQGKMEEGWADQIINELEPLRAALEVIVGWPKATTEAKPLFHSLQTLSVGAVMGREEEKAWKSAGNALRWIDIERQLGSVHDLFHWFVARTPTLEHVCLTPSCGALSFGTDLYFPRDGDSRPSISSHSHLPWGEHHHPSAIGVPSSSYYHNDRWVVSSAVARATMLDQIKSAITKRDQLIDEPVPPVVPDCDIQATIYRPFPTHGVMTPEHPDDELDMQPVSISEEDRAGWRDYLKSLEQDVASEVADLRKSRDPLPGGVKPKDKFSFRPLSEALPCLACGWRNESEE